MKTINYEFRICLENESQLPYVNYKGVFHTCHAAANLFDRDTYEHRELLLKLENLKLRREKEELESAIHREAPKSRGAAKLDGSLERENEHVNIRGQGTSTKTKRHLEFSPFSNQSMQNALASSSRNADLSDSERMKGFYTAKTNTSMTNLLNKLESKIANSLEKKQNVSKRMSKTAARDVTIRRIRLEEDFSMNEKNPPAQVNLTTNHSSSKNMAGKLFSKDPTRNSSQLKKILGRIKTSSKPTRGEEIIQCKSSYFDS